MTHAATHLNSSLYGTDIPVLCPIDPRGMIEKKPSGAQRRGANHTREFLLDKEERISGTFSERDRNERRGLFLIVMFEAEPPDPLERSFIHFFNDPPCRNSRGEHSKKDIDILVLLIDLLERYAFC